MCPIEEKTALRWKRSEVKVFEIQDSKLYPLDQITEKESTTQNRLRSA